MNLQIVIRLQQLVESLQYLEQTLDKKELDNKKREESLKVIEECVEIKEIIKVEMVEKVLMIMSVSFSALGLSEAALLSLCNIQLTLHKTMNDPFQSFFKEQRNASMTINTISVLINLINKCQNKQIILKAISLLKDILLCLNHVQLEQYFPKVCSTMFKVITQCHLYQKKTLKLSLDILQYTIIILNKDKQKVQQENHLFSSSKECPPQMDMFQQKLNEFIIVLNKKSQRIEFTSKMQSLDNHLTKWIQKILLNLGEQVQWQIEVNMVELAITSHSCLDPLSLHCLFSEWGTLMYNQMHIQEAIAQRLLNRLKTIQTIHEWQHYLVLLKALGCLILMPFLTKALVDTIIKGTMAKSQRTIKVINESSTNIQQLIIETIHIYDLDTNKHKALKQLLTIMQQEYHSEYKILQEQVSQDVQVIMHKACQYHLDNKEQSQLMGGIYLLYEIDASAEWFQQVVIIYQQGLLDEQALFQSLLIRYLKESKDEDLQKTLLTIELSAQNIIDMTLVQQLINKHRQAIQESILQQLHSIQRIEGKERGRLLVLLSQYLQHEISPLDCLSEYLSNILQLLTRLFEKYFVRGTLRFILLIQELVMTLGQYLSSNKAILSNICCDPSLNEHNHLANQWRILSLVSKQHLLSNNPQVLHNAYSITSLTFSIMHNLSLSKIQAQANFSTGDKDNVVINNGLPVILQEYMPTLLHLLKADGHLRQTKAIHLLMQLFTLAPLYLSTHFESYLLGPIKNTLNKIDLDLFTNQQLLNLLQMLTLSQQLIQTQNHTLSIQTHSQSLVEHINAFNNNLDKQAIYKPPILQDKVYLDIKQQFSRLIELNKSIQSK